MVNLKKKVIYIFLLIYLIIGSLTSLNIGISHDEYHEEENWKYNLKISKSISDKIIFQKKTDLKVEDYKDKYYGIGFQIISQPIQYLIKDTCQISNTDDYGSKLISKHFIVFLFFIQNFILFNFEKIVKNKNFCYLSTLIYFFYPYLLGNLFQFKIFHS